jgi:hypothetical protein
MGRLGAPLQSIVLRVADCTLWIWIWVWIWIWIWVWIWLWMKILRAVLLADRCGVPYAWCMQYMRCPVWRAADYMAGFGNSNAYAYWFGRRNEDEQEVYHGGELRYVFNSARQV